MYIFVLENISEDYEKYSQMRFDYLLIAIENVLIIILNI